jgi:hypothetical protein
MAVHQRVNHRGPSNIDVYFPKKGSAHLEGLISGGSTINLHRPKGSRLSMLINGKQRVEL